MILIIQHDAIKRLFMSMTSVQVIPHSLVRIEASVILPELSSAFEAVPHMPMTVCHSQSRRLSDPCRKVASSDMIDHFAEVVEDPAHIIAGGNA